MSRQNRHSTKTKAGRLRIEASAPGYDGAARSVHVAGPMHVTLRLYPRQDPLEPPIPPDDRNLSIWQPGPLFQPAPTLIVGLGGTGRHVLTHVKKNLLDIGFGAMPAEVRLAVIDTPDKDQKVSIGSVRLAAEEIVELDTDLKPLVERLRQQYDPDLSDWFPAAEYAQRLSDDELNLAYGSRQRRPLSRAMLIEDLRQGIFDEGIDILLLIDCSPSMEGVLGTGEEGLTRLQAAKQAALSFLSQIDRLVDRVGVVAFGEEAHEIVSISKPSEQIAQEVQSISTRDGTDIARALQLADDIFARNSAGERSKVVLLLSDGESEAQPAIEAAEQLRQKGIHLIAIGMGDASQDLLEQLASQWQGQPDVFYAADAHTLRHIYLRLARRIGQGSRVWRLLHSMASAVIAGEHFRVILVASLAGGFGGAVLADIAYLLRRIGYRIGAKNISIEAYLVDAPVFQQVASARYPVLQANAFAAMREIERFQLAQGFPFRMAYDSRMGEHPVLNDIMNWRLLDSVYLFDRLPVPGSDNSARERWFDPALSVFPMIADAICFALDEGAHTADWRNYRRNLQGLVTTEQWARGRAVAGSIGVFRYVFPVQDLFEVFKTRWAIRLIAYLLSGEANPALSLKPEQNQEESAKGLDRHVRLFLLGYAGYDRNPCPSALQAVGRVLVEGRDVLEEIDAKSAANLAEDTRGFRGYLSYALEVMLNGSGTNTNWRKARTGKMGYVLAFLARLEGYLRNAVNILSQTGWAAFARDCLNATCQARQQLLEMVARIHTDLVEVDSPAQPSLLAHLQALEKTAMERLEAHQRIFTHTLSIKPTDVDAFLEDALTAPQPIEEGLSRFYWVIDSDRGPMLTLHVGVQAELTARSYSLQPFITALLQLATQTGKEFFEKLRSSDWLKHDLSDVARRAWEISQPLVHFDPLQAPQVRPALILAVNGHIDRLEESLRQRLLLEQQFYPMRTSDPYHLLVLQTVDVVPIDAIETWKESRHVYHQWYGLTEGGQRDPKAESTAVFRAEAVSLRWEARLPRELRQAPRLFAPLLVTALEASAHARLFALAFASGWVQVNEYERYLRISLPDTVCVQVELPDVFNFSRRPSPYVLGIVYFAWQAAPTDVRAIEQALQTVDIEIWRQWTLPNWQQHTLATLVLKDKSPEANDFAAYTAMVVREEFRKRLHNRS